MRRGAELIKLMTIEAQQVASWMTGEINRQGGALPQWYVGVAADPKTRLFTDHSVNEAYGKWAFKQCTTSTIAREVEQYYLDNGAKGGPGGGDTTTKYVYAYAITASTRQ